MGRDPEDSIDVSARCRGQHLVEVDDSFLVVIDIQQVFLDKYDRAKAQSLISKVSWLLGIAAHLRVPVVAMAEDMAESGTLVEGIRAALPEGTPIYNKDFFGACANPEIFRAIVNTNRNTAVCVGVETDVCVMQTALGLLANGFRVIVLHDAVATTEWDERIGIERMRAAGVMIGSVKSLYYEWTRSVSACRGLDASSPLLRSRRPPDLVM
jgi:nicotinamidase-related amidase